LHPSSSQQAGQYRSDLLTWFNTRIFARKPWQLLREPSGSRKELDAAFKCGSELHVHRRHPAYVRYYKDFETEWEKTDNWLLTEQQRTTIVVQESLMAQSPSRRLEQQIILNVGAKHGRFFLLLSCCIIVGRWLRLLPPPQQEMCETWERTKKKTLIILRRPLRPRSSIRKGFRHPDPIPASCTKLSSP